MKYKNFKPETAMNKPMACFSLALGTLFTVLSASALAPMAANAANAADTGTAAVAAEWKLISETEDPEKIISWYVDMTSIVRDEDYLRAFLRTSWSVPQYAADRTAYQSTTYVNYFDCDSRKIAFTGNTYFSTVEPNGLPVHQEPKQAIEQLTFRAVIPGSAGETRLDFVCKFRSTNFLTRATVNDTRG